MGGRFQFSTTWSHTSLLLNSARSPGMTIPSVTRWAWVLLDSPMRSLSRKKELILFWVRGMVAIFNSFKRSNLFEMRDVCFNIQSTHLILLVPSCITQCHASFLLHYFLNRHELPAQPLPKYSRASYSTIAESDTSFLLRRSIKWTWPWTTAINWPWSWEGSARILSLEANQCQWQIVILGGPLPSSGPSFVLYIPSPNDVTSIPMGHLWSIPTDFHHSV